MQRKAISLLEQITNNAVGFIQGFLILNLIIVPIWGFQTSIQDQTFITILMIIVGIIRGYIFRRLFNSSSHQSRKASAIEQFINVGTGFIIYFLFWTFVIVPLWNLDSDIFNNLLINLIYFAFNYLRAFIIRRIYNHFTFKKLYKTN